MISKEHFEAHVRAEAKVKCPSPLPLPDDESRGELIDYFHELGKHEAYIAARMEHEWPLVEALQKLIALPSTGTRWAEWISAEAALSPYTKADTQTT